MFKYNRYADAMSRNYVLDIIKVLINLNYGSKQIHFYNVYLLYGNDLLFFYFFMLSITKVLEKRNLSKVISLPCLVLLTFRYTEQ